MNKVILSGNLCKDCELKQTQNGKAMLFNTIAVKKEFKNANGEYGTDFISIKCFGIQAEYLSKYASKGCRVELVGRWNTDTYESLHGEIRYVHECVVESITAFRKEEKQDNNYQAPSYNSNDNAVNNDPIEWEGCPY